MVSGLPSCIRRPLENGKTRARIIQRLTRGIQKLEKWADPLCPGCFVVLGALDAFVAQVDAEPPAFFEKHVAESLDFVHDALAFARADVQPDARVRLDGIRLSKTVNSELVPPHGGRERGNLSKNARMPQAKIE